MFLSVIRPGLVLILRMLVQKCAASEAFMLASVTMPMVWPWPLAPAFSSGFRP